MLGYHRIVASFLRDSLRRPGVLGRTDLAAPAAISYVHTARCGFSSLGQAVVDSPCHRQFIDNAKKAYGGNQEVDAAIAEMLSSKRLVLFMEGSLDHPKSLCAGNLSKVFTSLQMTGITTVDLLRHPEILGYLCTHMNESVRNVLFKDGKPLLDYDHIMELFNKGTLLQALKVTPKKADPSSHKHLKDFLPIANY